MSIIIKAFFNKRKTILDRNRQTIHPNNQKMDPSNNTIKTYKKVKFKDVSN